MVNGTDSSRGCQSDDCPLDRGSQLTPTERNQDDDHQPSVLEGDLGEFCLSETEWPSIISREEGKGRYPLSRVFTGGIGSSDALPAHGS